MKERISKSIFWIVWSRLGLQGLAFLSSLAVVRILSPADYGLMALAGVWIYIFSLVVEVDLGSAIIQFPDLDDTELNACFWLTTCLTFLGCAFLIFASSWIADWFSSPKLGDILPIVALTLPIAGAKVVPYGLLKKALEFDKVAKAEIAASLISIPSVLSMAWFGAGVWALVAGALIPMVVQSIGIFWFVRWRPGLHVKGKRVGQMLRYSLSTTGSNIAWSLWSKSPALILGKLNGEVVLGFYTVSMEIATTLQNRITTMVQQLAFPVMAELQTNPAALRHAFLKGLRLIACITFPISIGILLLAEDFVLVVLTGKWKDVIPILQLLCMFGSYHSLWFLFPVIFKVRYRTNLLLCLSLIRLGVMPLVFFVGAKFAGASGVAIAWLIGFPLTTLSVAPEVFKEIGIGWKILWRQISQTTGATVVMASMVLFSGWCMEGDEQVMRVARMGTEIVVGALSYGLIILLFGGELSREIKKVAGSVLGFMKS